MTPVICEVGPRDGLQALARHFSVDERIELIHRLAAAGLRQIEAVSFVSPRAVPQMAGADRVLAGLDLPAGVTVAALALNRRGAELALRAGVDELRYVVVASDAFSLRNQNVTTAQGLADFAAAAALARAQGTAVTGVIATAFGCPFEGRVDPHRVAGIAAALAAAGAGQVVFADTIGVAVPGDLGRVVSACCGTLAGLGWGVHLHNTRNTGFAVLMRALDLGARVIDASVGGLGGCPFAPRATGNIATEDVNYLLTREGIETGLDHDRLVAVVDWLAERVPAALSGQLARAGWFGPRAGPRAAKRDDQPTATH